MARFDESPRSLANDHFVTYWRRRQNEEQARNEELASQARADLRRIVATLREQFGAGRVILFGSLVRQRFLPDSDIDLAVEGLTKADFFAVLAHVNELSRFWVDVKPLEDLDPYFRQRVLETGVELP